MSEKEKDGRIDKLWYLPDWYDQASAKTDMLKRICSENDIITNWEQVDDWNRVKTYPYIFLSRAPLTFGHSQLVVPAPSKNDAFDEAVFFEAAACLITRAIAAFGTAFSDKKIQEDEEYRGLADLTETSAKYIKTLILRASASENVGREYKVHLVPYFESHDVNCTERFRNMHQLPDTSERKGGLLGWLGKRESHVDQWEVSSTFPKTLDGIATDDLHLEGLAKKFRSLWRL